MNHKKAIYIFLTAFLFQTVEADILENLGWQKKVDDFIKTLKDCDDDDNKYKCVQCLYTIFKSFYGEYILPEKYNIKLKDLISNEKTMKIKFKMMDILERK